MKKKNNQHLKKGFTERVSETLDLPKTLTMHLPRLILTGHREVYMENYRGIVAYGQDFLLLATPAKHVRICGKCLSIRAIAGEAITVEGEIDSVSFEGGV